MVKYDVTNCEHCGATASTNEVTTGNYMVADHGNYYEMYRGRVVFHGPVCKGSGKTAKAKDVYVIEAR